MKLYEQAQARLVSPQGAEISEFLEKVSTLTDEVKVKDMELHHAGSCERGYNAGSEEVKLPETIAGNDAIVTVMSGLQKEFWAAEKAVVDSLPTVEMSLDLRVDAEKKACLAWIELSLIKQRETSSDGAMAAVNKECFAILVSYATLR